MENMEKHGYLVIGESAIAVAVGFTKRCLY